MKIQYPIEKEQNQAFDKTDTESVVVSALRRFGISPQDAYRLANEFEDCVGLPESKGNMEALGVFIGCEFALDIIKSTKDK